MKLVSSASLPRAAKFPKECLPFFTGLRVRIFAHHDPSGGGVKAATKWTAQLEEAGADVDTFLFDDLLCSDHGGEVRPVKDLNDMAFILPESFELHREVVENAMLF